MKAILILMSAVELLAIDNAKLGLIPVRMKSYVDKGTIAGSVTLVQHEGKVVSLEAVGWQDLDKKIPMKTDTIFEIMSMTKPVTGVAIMQLAEEGKLVLSDAVEKYLPEYRGLKMQDGSKPSRLITLRDLMTHTSGMPEYGPEATKDIYTRFHYTLREAVLLYSQLGLLFQPGTKWQYSNTGLASLGRIVEVVSDKPYEKYLAERIFEPLGMKDTFFFPAESQYPRIARVYSPVEGKLRDIGDVVYRKSAKYPMPEGGMYATAADMARFYQMALNGGTLDGKRILSKASMQVMTELHTGAIEPAGHAPGMGYGLTWAVSRDAAATLSLSSVGSYGHGGAFGTQGFIDPPKKLVGVFMIQRLPGGGPEVSVFRELATAAVE